MNRSVKVAVIGAGVCGLVAARELQREHHRVVVFEQNDRIGGAWVYDPRTESDPLGMDPNRETVHSSLYLSMRTNLPRALMGFLDYPFQRTHSRDPRTFPGHEEVLRFLNQFADEFGLRELIRLNTKVVRVEPVEERKDEWIVEWKSQGSESVSREVFEAVVVCSGRNTTPKVADIPGIRNWGGYQIHSHNYRVPEPFHGQVVVLVGYRASAFDISHDIAPVAKEVHIATKDNRFGVKLEGVIYHDMIKCVNEDGSLVFEDGSSIFADAIIHCTGYKYHFPFLKTNGVVTIHDYGVRPLYKHVFPPALAPWLSFIGLTLQDPIYLIAELQCKWVARVLSGKIPLPTEEEMMGAVEEIYQQMEKNGIPEKYYHHLRPLQLDYKQLLAAQIGLPPPEEWRENLALECFKKIIELQHKYRDQWDDAYWDDITQTQTTSTS